MHLRHLQACTCELLFSWLEHSVSPVQERSDKAAAVAWQPFHFGRTGSFLGEKGGVFRSIQRSKGVSIRTVRSTILGGKATGSDTLYSTTRCESGCEGGPGEGGDLVARSDRGFGRETSHRKHAGTWMRPSHVHVVRSFPGTHPFAPAMPRSSTSGHSLPTACQDDYLERC